MFVLFIHLFVVYLFNFFAVIFFTQELGARVDALQLLREEFVGLSNNQTLSLMLLWEEEWKNK